MTAPIQTSFFDELGSELRRAANKRATGPRHECHADGCHTTVQPRYLMCPKHWRIVPKHLKDAVWNEYRPGQEVDKQPTRAYLDAAQAAIDYVAAWEGRR